MNLPRAKRDSQILGAWAVLGSFLFLVIALHDLPDHRRLVCFGWVAWSGYALSAWGGRQLAGASLERAWALNQRIFEKGLEPFLRGLGIEDPSAHWRLVGKEVGDEFKTAEAQMEKDQAKDGLVPWAGTVLLFGIGDIITLLVAWFLSSMW